MRFFGGKTDDDQNSSSQSARNGSQEPPSEHTRLLPNRVDSDANNFLQPDDPAVSPYNLWSVRALRFLTVLFTLITFVWWILQLVGTFATPPGLHARGSAFFSFSYASLTFANMLFTLIFFTVPSSAVRGLSVAIALLFLTDTIITASVQKTRIEEGWVGIASVVWALLMSLWTLLSDRAVKWGKAEEEERLTGRVETRRTLTEWSEVLLMTVAYSIMAVAALLITLTLILRSLDAAVGAPGHQYWVDAHKYRIHVYCKGNHTDSDGTRLPTVLFEGGERPVEQGLWQLGDAAIRNGTISRYCFVDRPGFAWSDAAPSPLSAGMAVDAMSEALAQAGEDGPWVLVSAGIGSIYSRVFSARHGKEVEGMLLIDPLHEDLLPRVASSSRGFFLWLRGAISPLGIDRLAGAIFRGRGSVDRVWGRSCQQTEKYIFAKLQESLVADSFTKRDVESSRVIQYKSTPLSVISSGRQIKKDKKWESKQRDLTKITDQLEHWDIVDKAPHQVWETLEGRDMIEKRLKQLVRKKSS